MSRCIICDRSNDVDFVTVRIRYNKEAKGYTCEDCDYEVYSSIEELEERDREIVASGDEDRPEITRGGEEQQLSFRFSTLRQEEEDNPVSVQLVQNSSNS